MVQVIINPGSGPVSNACLHDANANMEALKADVAAETGIQNIHYYSVCESTEDGRYSFVMNVGERAFDIDMPGIPLERVRYLKTTTESCWNFPRLYVDGSSWLWRFAVDIIVDSLSEVDG